MPQEHACVPAVQGTKEGGCIAFRARKGGMGGEKDWRGMGKGRKEGVEKRAIKMSALQRMSRI